MATDETTSKAIDVSQSAQRPPTAAQRRATEHAGTTDTEILARNIAQTREELSVTIDAIVDRVSPKKVVERGKQQAREGVQDATEIVKGHATTAAGLLKEKAVVVSGVVKEKVAELRGSGDTGPARSSATSSRIVAPASTAPSPDAGPVSSPGSSPLPPSTVSIDAGAVPPPEVPTSTGSPGPRVSDLPSHRPVTTTGAVPVPPVYAGAGAAALLAAVLLLLRRRSVRRRNRVRRR